MIFMLSCRKMLVYIRALCEAQTLEENNSKIKSTVSTEWSKKDEIWKNTN